MHGVHLIGKFSILVCFTQFLSNYNNSGILTQSLSFVYLNIYYLLMYFSLELLLNLPLTFVKPILPNFGRPLQKVFSTGQPIKLVEKGILNFDLSQIFGQVFFYLKWANPGLFFVYFRSFQTNITNFYNKYL